MQSVCKAYPSSALAHMGKTVHWGVAGLHANGGQPELCGGLHLTPSGHHPFPHKPSALALLRAPPKNRSCAALRPVKALVFALHVAGLFSVQGH